MMKCSITSVVKKQKKIFRRN